MTKTGAEAFAIQTAPPSLYPSNEQPFAPLYNPPISGSGSSNFTIFKTWGNLAPWYSVPSSKYGLDNASPGVSDKCSITQVVS